MGVPRYSRWQYEFSQKQTVDRVVFASPNGEVETRPVFVHQPVVFSYDEHGYESVTPIGEPVVAVRFFPKQLGKYSFSGRSGESIVEEGEFSCVDSEHPGYVEISEADSRYFCYSDGTPFVAIGVNLCMPPYYKLPAGTEHFITRDEMATMGASEYRRWFRLMAENGANFTRLWLSGTYFGAEGDQAGEVDLIAIARLDNVVDLARSYGIRLKLCFDHWRTIEPGSFFHKRLVDPQSGRSPLSVDEWYRDPLWKGLWLKKVRSYMDRYAGDPTIMAWELWNEIDAVNVSSFEIVREWTQEMLLKLQPMAKNQLVVNSLGSFDAEWKIAIQEDFMMEEMAFQQVHRYLDQGAAWEICRVDPVAFSLDAIQRARRPDRPVLLAETGAVNDNHTGPFRYFRMDYRGTIFHDTTFPAFFGGAAGTGHDWFWSDYVDTQNVWEQFSVLATILRGVAVDQEEFEPVDLSNTEAWFLALVGKNWLLAWTRNRKDRWDHLLRDGKPVPPANISIDLQNIGFIPDTMEAFPSWVSEKGNVHINGQILRVDNLNYGFMLRLRRGQA